MTHRRSLLAAAVLAALIVLSGCGAVAEKAGEKAAERAIESQTGADVDLDTGDGSVRIETEDGTAEIGNGEIPDQWPDDVPVPDDFAVLTSSAADGAEGPFVALVGTSERSPEELLATLKEALSDWEISGETTTSSGSGSLTGAEWEVDGRRVTFAAQGGADAPTNVTLGHTTLS